MKVRGAGKQGREDACTCDDSMGRGAMVVCVAGSPQTDSASGLGSGAAAAPQGTTSCTQASSQGLCCLRGVGSQQYASCK